MDVRVWGTLVLATIAAGCGGDGDESFARLAPADACAGAEALEDPADDARHYRQPAPEGDPPSRPEADLRRFEIRADREGLCVRWTTQEPASEGMELVVVVHGPFQVMPGGGSVAHPYGFDVELREDGARATAGLARVDSRAPRVLDATIGQSGRVVSAFVPRSELDTPAANQRGRPAFPYDGFTFHASARSELEDGVQTADFAPDEGESATWVDGGLCPEPCNELPPERRAVPQP